MISFADYLEMQARLNRKPEQTEELPTSIKVIAESELHAACIGYFRSRGWCYFHGSMAHKSRRTTGEPDFSVAADNGITFWIELKVGDNKLTPEQQQIRAWLLKLGHRYILARQIEDVIEGTTLMMELK